jgi:hypothetical protein
MNIAMHLELSQVIRKAVEKELHIKLNAFRFMYGNIKPDIIQTSIPHYKHTAMGYVQAEIEKLSSLKFSKSPRWLKQFSESLGIITHYLSDFFCYAHSDYFQGEITRHFLYEFRQFCYFQRKYKLASLYNPLTPAYIQLSAANLNNCIEAAHDKYRSVLTNNLVPYEWDSSNAVNICILVCVSLLSMCIENQLIIAA